jgi:hypothetical protein
MNNLSEEELNEIIKSGNYTTLDDGTIARTIPYKHDENGCPIYTEEEGKALYLLMCGDVDLKPKPEKQSVKFGTRELSDVSINSLIGCHNGCLYCFAAHKAIEKGFVPSQEAWTKEKEKNFSPNCTIKYDGRVMYPTAHDITGRFLHTHIKNIAELLKSGNDLLICSKAREKCMQKVAEACIDYKDKVIFMVTITTFDEAQSIFWEPNAPLPMERIAALQYLHGQGFSTSVLIEPLLQGPASAMSIYQAVEPYVTDLVWIGTMNSADTRVNVAVPENAKAVEAIKRYHSIDNLRFLYSSMKDLPKVQFKSSITRIFEK